MKKAIIVCLTILLLTTPVTFAGSIEKRLKKQGLHVAELTDIDKINLQINRLEQAVQQQWSDVILQMLSKNYQEINPAFTQSSIEAEVEALFARLSEARGLSTETNPQSGWSITATHDFYIQNIKITDQGDKAKAECEIGFSSAGRMYRKTREVLSFAKNQNAWFLSGSKNLFGFLDQASHAQPKELPAPVSRSQVMQNAKDDFTSTHMLVPVNLFVFDGTPVPRFNMTESFRWFRRPHPVYGSIPINIMNYPMGIVADVLVTPRGEDELNHNFLFISDVTSHKILGTQMNQWIAEFGTEGGDQNQFREPYGMSSLLSSFYFVTERLNNRVSVYEFQNGWSHPQWQFALEAGLDHPIDVEVKERNESDPQDETRIVVADMYNHRLAFFLWHPYPVCFDRFYGEYGSGQGQFLSPASVCFGRDPDFGWHTDDVYVTDKGNHRLVRLYVGPDDITWVGSYQFSSDVDLTSVEVDNKGLIYVVDRRQGKIYKLAPSVQYPGVSLVGIWGERGKEDGQLYKPDMIQVAHGRLCPHPYPCYPLTSLGDIFVTEAWSDETGVRRFVIAADVLNLTADWVPYNESTGEGNFIWWEYHLTDFGTVTEQVLRGAEVCTTYNRGSLNYGPQGGAWPVDGHPHGTYYTVKVSATSIYDPTIVIEKTVDVYVDTLSTHDPVITQGIRCNWKDTVGVLCNECWHCIIEWQEYTLDVQAYHPDGYPLSYVWKCGRGHFHIDDWISCNPCTTETNEICYYAPEAPTDKGADPYEFIQVKVRDPYGGSNSTSIYTNSIFESGTSCLCGDANKDGMVTAGDVAYLISYLFRGGPPPQDPIERGDANNDCVISGADVNYLIEYLYREGEPPECCWLHEPSE